HSDVVAVESRTAGYQATLWTTRAFELASVLALLAFCFVWIAKRPAWIGPITGSVTVALLLGAIAGLAVFNAMTPRKARADVPTDREERFTLVVRDFLPSSGEKIVVGEPDSDGAPLLRVALLTKPPNANVASDAFDGRGWLAIENAELNRASLDAGTALITF